jgi:hypothetical protein
MGRLAQRCPKQKEEGRHAREYFMTQGTVMLLRLKRTPLYRPHQGVEDRWPVRRPKSLVNSTIRTDTFTASTDCCTLRCRKQKGA